MPTAETSAPPELTTYKCARCGFEYARENDKPPHLCFRCMQHLAKTMFRAVTEDKYRTLTVTVEQNNVV